MKGITSESIYYYIFKEQGLWLNMSMILIQLFFILANRFDITSYSFAYVDVWMDPLCVPTWPLWLALSPLLPSDRTLNTASAPVERVHFKALHWLGYDYHGYLTYCISAEVLNFGRIRHEILLKGKRRIKPLVWLFVRSLPNDTNEKFIIIATSPGGNVKKLINWSIFWYSNCLFFYSENYEANIYANVSKVGGAQLAQMFAKECHFVSAEKESEKSDTVTMTWKSNCVQQQTIISALLFCS